MGITSHKLYNQEDMDGIIIVIYQGRNRPKDGFAEGVQPSNITIFLDLWLGHPQPVLCGGKTW
jgi:hypothetical protein